MLSLFCPHNFCTPKSGPRVDQKHKSWDVNLQFLSILGTTSIKIHIKHVSFSIFQPIVHDLGLNSWIKFGHLEIIWNNHQIPSISPTQLTPLPPAAWHPELLAQAPVSAPQEQPLQQRKLLASGQEAPQPRQRPVPASTIFSLRIRLPWGVAVVDYIFMLILLEETNYKILVWDGLVTWHNQVCATFGAWKAHSMDCLGASSSWMVPMSSNVDSYSTSGHESAGKMDFKTAVD